MIVWGEKGRGGDRAVSCLLIALLAAGTVLCTVHPTRASAQQAHVNYDRLALSDIGKAEPDTVEDLPPAESGIPEDALTKDGDSLETGVTDEDAHAPPRVTAPPILYDLTSLPEPVRRMRDLIIAAASEGDIENLRPLLGTGPTQTQLSISGLDGDPIDFLRETSGDGKGQELLAILLDILNAGFVHLDAGGPNESYLWPYFYSVPLDQLENSQMVELYRIVTAGDYEDMRAYGGYNFYRTAIGPDGDWKFYVAGD
ncbi:MAG: hypothetical protein P1V13_08735 [Rhizobiaceae bacterium]|nr:hypothetical protein [Rhizobiaceae bacterium]